MSHRFPPELQQAIQQSLLAIAVQLGQPIEPIAAAQLYQDASELLHHIPH